MSTTILIAFMKFFMCVQPRWAKTSRESENGNNSEESDNMNNTDSTNNTNNQPPNFQTMSNIDTETNISRNIEVDIETNIGRNIEENISGNTEQDENRSSNNESVFKSRHKLQRTPPKQRHNTKTTNSRNTESTDTSKSLDKVCVITDTFNIDDKNTSSSANNSDEVHYFSRSDSLVSTYESFRKSFNNLYVMGKNSFANKKLKYVNDDKFNDIDDMESNELDVCDFEDLDL